MKERQVQETTCTQLKIKMEIEKLRWQILGDVSSNNNSDIQIGTTSLIAERHKLGSQDQRINGVRLTITDFKSNKSITQRQVGGW